MILSEGGRRRWGRGPRRHTWMAATAAAGLIIALVPALGTAQSAAAPAAQAFTVSVDAHTAENQAAFLAYYPNQLTAHAGDTVEFAWADSGEPHTVTFGTIVDSVMTKFAAGGDPTTDPNFAKLPVLLPQGPGDANQVAANPCFIASGDPPTDAATPCPQMTPPEFDGSASFYNSGWVAGGDAFTMTLSPTIKAGTYSYLCLLHGPGMGGTITVVDSATAVPTPDEVTTTAQSQIDATVAKLQPAVAQANTATAAMANAGVLSPDVQDAFGIMFAPATLSVPVGGTATWILWGPHTISFNAPQDAVGARVLAPDGTIHINPLLFAPSNSPGQPAPAGGTPAPNAPPTAIDAGTWDGTGFLSSGAVVSFPPDLYTYSVTFSTAGTYTFVCLIHPDMQGTIKVG